MDMYDLMKNRLWLLLLLLLTVLIACERRGSINRTNEEASTIANIQGCSHQSPFDGKAVSDVVGIVTAKSYNGFYMQSEVADELNCTSEGIFIFTEDFPEVIPGDKVIVSGRVEEFLPGQVEDRNLTITEIIDPEIRTISSGNILPEAVKVGSIGRLLPDQVIDNDSLMLFDPEKDGVDFYESLESMLVYVEDGVVVGPRNPFNEVVTIPPDYRDINAISSAGTLLQRESDPNPERVILNLNSENNQRVNVGAELKGRVTGVMDYSYGNYKIKAFGKAGFSESNPTNPEINVHEDSLTLVTYNVENLALQDPDSKFHAIASDIVDEISEPDIVILHEVMDDSGVENDATVTASRTVERLIAEFVQLGGTEYSFLVVDPVNNQDGGISGGNIRSVILYRSDKGITLSSEGVEAGMRSNPMTIGPVEWPFSTTRKPLVALFERDSRKILVVAVHLTSRGLDSPLFGSVQPIERLEEEKRVAQAVYLEKYLSGFRLANPETFIILAGDLNDYPWSKTLSVLTAGTMNDAGTAIEDNERFSYIYDGNAFQLDHILVSNPDAIRQYTIPHLNTIFDHTLQVSDHDPVWVELDLESVD